MTKRVFVKGMSAIVNQIVKMKAEVLSAVSVSSREAIVPIERGDLSEVRHIETVTIVIKLEHK